MRNRRSLLATFTPRIASRWSPTVSIWNRSSSEIMERKQFLLQRRHDLLRLVFLHRHVQFSFRVIFSHSCWTNSRPSRQNEVGDCAQSFCHTLGGHLKI